MQTHAIENEKINKPPAFNLGFFREQYILQILTTNSSSTTYNTYVHLPGNNLRCQSLEKLNPQRMLGLSVVE